MMPDNHHMITCSSPISDHMHLNNCSDAKCLPRLLRLHKITSLISDHPLSYLASQMIRPANQPANHQHKVLQLFCLATDQWSVVVLQGVIRRCGGGEVINRAMEICEGNPMRFRQIRATPDFFTEGISGWACEHPHQSLYIIACRSKNAADASFREPVKRDNVLAVKLIEMD